MSVQRISQLFFLSWVFLIAAGCAGKDPIDGNSVEVADSDGVRLVRHQQDRNTTSVTVEPIWVYGHQPSQYMFQSVLYGALVDDGSVVVADLGNQEVVAIDPRGAAHEILARTGQGPGEVLSPRAVVGAGGRTVWVEDPGNGKLMRFEGRTLVSTLSTVHVPVLSGGLMPLGVTADGRVLMTTSRFRPGFVQPWLYGSMVTLEPEGGVVDTVGSYPLARNREEGALNPFPPHGVVASTGGRFVNARTDQPTLTWRTADGEITQIVRWEPVEAYPTESTWASFKASVGEDLRRVNPQLSGKQLEGSVDEQVARFEMDPSVPLPLFGSIHGTSGGDVWLADFSPGHTWPSAYRVISSAGEWTGRVVFRKPTRILDIGGDLVLCVVRDHVDVQGIALYRYRLES